MELNEYEDRLLRWQKVLQGSTARDERAVEHALGLHWEAYGNLQTHFVKHGHPTSFHQTIGPAEGQRWSVVWRQLCRAITNHYLIGIATRPSKKPASAGPPIEEWTGSLFLEHSPLLRLHEMAWELSLREAPRPPANEWESTGNIPPDLLRGSPRRSHPRRLPEAPTPQSNPEKVSVKELIQQPAVYMWWDCLWHMNQLHGHPLFSTPNPTAFLLEAFEAGLEAWWRQGENIHYLLRPDLHQDSRGRFHGEAGPAIQWDLQRVYAWHGVVIPEDLILDPGSLTAQDILNEPNLEVRRAMVEILGFDRLIQGRKPVDHDPEQGTLYPHRHPSRRTLQRGRGDVPLHGAEIFPPRPSHHPSSQNGSGLDLFFGIQRLHPSSGNVNFMPLPDSTTQRIQRWRMIWSGGNTPNTQRSVIEKCLSLHMASLGHPRHSRIVAFTHPTEFMKAITPTPDPDWVNSWHWTIDHLSQFFLSLSQSFQDPASSTDSPIYKACTGFQQFTYLAQDTLTAQSARLAAWRHALTTREGDPQWGFAQKLIRQTSEYVAYDLVWADQYSLFSFSNPAAYLLEAYEAGLEAWWPQPHGIHILTRPTFHLDSQQRVHHETGPAVIWGSRPYFAWHGVAVPEKVITSPSSLTPFEILHESNLEVRRVMLDRGGYDILAREAKVVHHQPGNGTLYHIFLPLSDDLGQEDDETVSDIPLAFVGVKCPSTDRKYYIRVPPALKKVSDAIAWTFGFSGNSYNPLQET